MIVSVEEKQPEECRPDNIRDESGPNLFSKYNADPPKLDQRSDIPKNVETEDCDQQKKAKSLRCLRRTRIQ